MKEEMLAKLYEQYGNRFSGKETVPGEGNADSRLLLIGEAPGRDEVKLGRPFVGAAGRNLDEFLEITGISRSGVYITNAVKYRLSKVNDRTGTVSNRPATKTDIDGSRKFLIREIQIISPDFIVTLGNVPLKAVTGDYSASIGNVHGRVLNVMIGDAGYKVFPLYHPASVIYNRELKDTYTRDLLELKKIAGA